MASDKSVSQDEVNKKVKKKIKFIDLNDTDKILYSITYQTNGFTGADIESLVREAGMIALRESKETKQVRVSHFEEALKKIKPSVSKPILEVYKKIEDNFIKTAKSTLPIEGSYLG